MSAEEPLKILSNLVGKAHEHINPVVEVRRGMRDAGITTDLLTLDCLRTQRRINLILHDQQTDVMLYQFVTREEEVGGNFREITLTELSSSTLFDWMQDYFG